MLDTFKTFIYGRLSINWKKQDWFANILQWWDEDFVEILGIETKTNWLSMGNNKMSG